MEKGTLYIVATPIGNLDDITLRAIDTLKTVDFIFCEDTRVTGVLLQHFSIKTPTETYHQHSSGQVVAKISDLLKSGKNIALVTDAGTPGVSDPGNELISDLILYDSAVKISPIPGASALTAALSVAGFPTERVTYFGFPPHKNKRKKFFESVSNIDHTAVFYESGYRIADAMEILTEIAPNKKICVCRELTKKFETIYRGTVQEVLSQKFSEKGEFVIVVR